MSQYQIVVTDIVIEFLEVAFNNILYLRKFYPAEMFAEKKIYSTVTHVSRHPQLNDYADNVLKTIRQLLITDRSIISSINLAFIDKHKRIIEKYVFNFSSLPYHDSLEEDPYFVDTEQHLRNLCLKLSMATSYLAALPEESSFSINMETRKSACVTLTENSVSQSFPWILDDGTTDLAGADSDSRLDDKSLLPLAAVKSLALEIYLLGSIKDSLYKLQHEEYKENRVAAMEWSRYRILLAVTMVVTGSFNTLSVKYADQQIVPGLDGQPRHFNHPFMQSSFMFLGEMLCLLVFKIVFAYLYRREDGSAETNSLTKGSRTFNPVAMLIPACCDMVATSIMYVGLNLTYASSFQMLRGAVIVFTGILSVGFLNRKLGSREWFGIGLVIVGLGLVGASDLIVNNTSNVGLNSVLTGDLLIICAQVISAVQMVVEEKFISGQDIPPLQAVGWEGLFGFAGIFLLIIPLNFIPGVPPFADNSRGTLEASLDAFAQIGNSGRLLMAIVGITLSIAFFNFAGLSITKEMSATTRMILDSVRTIVIWAFSLAFGWQKFHYLQLIGFTVLLIGMSCYNNVIIPQLVRKCQSRLGRHRAPQPDQVRVLNATADDVDESR